MKKLVSLILISLMVSGCVSTIKNKRVAKKSAPDQPKPSYYNFPDILIPLALKKNREGSVIYMNSNTKAGVLALTGRAKFGYLVNFFQENMEKDNWTLVSENETSSRMILMFKKKCRWCIVDIDGSSSTAEVNIWVTPTSSASKGTGLLK